MTRVWPALWPPWNRTTTSACSDSQSTILPLPSSPHWAPTTTTFAIVPCLTIKTASQQKTPAQGRGWGENLAKPHDRLSAEGQDGRAIFPCRGIVPHRQPPVDGAAPAKLTRPAPDGRLGGR